MTSADFRLFLGMCILGLFIAAPWAVHADPIKDGSLDPYRAGWFSNSSRSGPLTCVETCKTKARGSLAEYEASGDPPAKRSFLCKVQVERGKWAYGNQFDERPACYTVGRDLKGSYEQRYMCLCVVRPQ